MHAPKGISWQPRIVSSVKEELEVVAPSKLVIECVSKTFKGGRSGHVHALDQVSLKVGEGEFVCSGGRERLREVDSAQYYCRSGKAR